jgi:hypothetical protein
MVNESCGIAVPTAHADEAQRETANAAAMTSLSAMPAEQLERLSTAAIARADELSWVRLTERVVGCGVES